MKPVKITNKQMREIMKEAQEMESDLMKEHKDVLSKLKLDKPLRQDVNKRLDELQERPYHEIVNEDDKVLLEYLLCINDWRRFVTHVTNLYNVWYKLVAKPNFQAIMRQEKAKLVLNPKKKYSSEKEKEEELLIYNEEVAMAHKRMIVAEANCVLLKGADESVYGYNFVVQLIIKKFNREWMLSHKDVFMLMKNS
jgi:hypothetical protein